MTLAWILVVHGTFWGQPENVAVSIHPTFVQCEQRAALKLPHLVRHACVPSFRWIQNGKGASHE